MWFSPVLGEKALWVPSHFELLVTKKSSVEENMHVQAAFLRKTTVEKKKNKKSVGKLNVKKKCK